MNTVSRRSKLIARTVSRCAPGATRTKRQGTGVAEAPSESTVTKIDAAGPPRVCAVTRMIPVESASARPTIGGGGPESAGNHSQRSTDLPTTREWQALVAMPNEKARSAALRMGAIRLRPRGTTVPDAAIWMHRLTNRVELRGHYNKMAVERSETPWSLLRPRQLQPALCGRRARWNADHFRLTLAEYVDHVEIAVDAEVRHVRHQFGVIAQQRTPIGGAGESLQGAAFGNVVRLRCDQELGPHPKGEEARERHFEPGRVLVEPHRSTGETIRALGLIGDMARRDQEAQLAGGGGFQVLERSIAIFVEE